MGTLIGSEIGNLNFMQKGNVQNTATTTNSGKEIF